MDSDLSVLSEREIDEFDKLIKQALSKEPETAVVMDCMWNTKVPVKLSSIHFGSKFNPYMSSEMFK